MDGDEEDHTFEEMHALWQTHPFVGMQANYHGVMHEVCDAGYMNVKRPKEHWFLLLRHHQKQIWRYVSNV